MNKLEQAITTISDYPTPGVKFRDITSLVENPQAFAEACEQLAAPFADAGIQKVLAIEARGFVFGGAVAVALGAGMVMARKPGKLPRKVIAQTYELEYGKDMLCLHVDAIKPGERVLLLDDLIATGGTAMAATDLAQKLGAEVVAAGFVVALPELGGLERLQSRNIQTHALLEYEGD